MIRYTSPASRPISPAISEISVGSPSPPPAGLYLHHATAFRPLNMKRIRLESPTNQQSVAAKMAAAAAATANTSAAAAAPLRRKSSAERMKSFSIADILGKRDEGDEPRTQERESQPAAPCPPLIAPPPPAPMPQAPPSLIPAHLLHGPMHMRPFFPPALLQYEQRLAWDYQRQLQEHFHAQAQLLRQMSLDPTIIPSEDGSERSRSSSTGSDCCSPEVNVSNDDADARTKDDDAHCAAGAGVGAGEKSARQTIEAEKKIPGDTPLDALFQLSTKNFDEEQDPATLNIFATRPNPKKKRKSRTAFTNHQIFELEKRFLYQKYLSPADRDEIAAGLGLSNAQVITWFQNRRAKLKRDMEELKKDVESVKQLHDQSADTSNSPHQTHHHHPHHSQHMQHQRQPHAMPPHHHPLTLPLTLTEAALAVAVTHPANPAKTRATNSTAAEDKKEIKMLKMMTLMYYSSRPA